MTEKDLVIAWKERLQLRKEADRVWENAIRQVYGDINVDLKNWNKNKQSYEYHLENGLIFRP